MLGEIVNFIVTTVGTAASASGPAIQTLAQTSPQVAQFLKTLAQNPDAIGKVVGWFVDEAVGLYEEHQAARDQQPAGVLKNYPLQYPKGLEHLTLLGLDKPPQQVNHKTD